MMDSRMNKQNLLCAAFSPVTRHARNARFHNPADSNLALTLWHGPRLLVAG